MKHTAVLFCVLVAVALFSCSRPDDTSFTITGKLAGGKGLPLVLQEMDTREIRPVDSVITNGQGEFSFSRSISEAGFWLLKARSGKILVLMVNPGDRIEISGSSADFPDRVEVKGAKEAEMLEAFYRITRKNEREVDSLETLLLDRQGTPGYYELTQKIDTLFRGIWESQRKAGMDYIGRNPGSISSLVVLNYAFGKSPVLNPDSDYAWYRKVDSALEKTHPGNKHVKYHHERMEAMRKIKKLQ